MKSGNKTEQDILKIVLSALKNAQIAKNAPLTEDEELKTVFAEGKKLKDAIDLYKKGGREDLAKIEEEQLGYVQKYLPQQASAGDIEKAVDEVIAQTGATGPQQMGKVMGAVMAKLQGKADGAIVSEIVKKKLSQNA